MNTLTWSKHISGRAAAHSCAEANSLTWQQMLIILLLSWKRKAWKWFNSIFAVKGPPSILYARSTAQTCSSSDRWEMKGGGERGWEKVGGGNWRKGKAAGVSWPREGEVRCIGGQIDKLIMFPPPMSFPCFCQMSTKQLSGGHGATFESYSTAPRVLSPAQQCTETFAVQKQLTLHVHRVHSCLHLALI